MFKKLKRYAYQLSHPIIGDVLMFHRVTPNRSLFLENSAYEVTPEFFEKTLLSYRDKHYDFISVDEMYDILSGKKEQKRKFACVTFDDGYKDNYEVAYPILKRYVIPFTIFVATDYVNRKALLNGYLLEYIIRNNNQLMLPDGKMVRCDTLEAKKQTMASLCGYVSTMTKSEIQVYFSSYVDDCYSMTDFLMMDVSTLKQISADSLCTIGSHTMSHNSLLRESPSIQDKEFALSQKILEEVVGYPVVHFAPPYGEYKRVALLLAKHYYKTLFLGFGGSVRKGDGCYQIKRVFVKEQ